MNYSSSLPIHPSNHQSNNNIMPQGTSGGVQGNSSQQLPASYISSMQTMPPPCAVLVLEYTQALPTSSTPPAITFDPEDIVKSIQYLTGVSIGTVQLLSCSPNLPQAPEFSRVITLPATSQLVQGFDLHRFCPVIVLLPHILQEDVVRKLQQVLAAVAFPKLPGAPALRMIVTPWGRGYWEQVVANTVCSTPPPTHESTQFKSNPNANVSTSDMNSGPRIGGPSRDYHANRMASHSPIHSMAAPYSSSTHAQQPNRLSQQRPPPPPRAMHNLSAHNNNNNNVSSTPSSSHNTNSNSNTTTTSMEPINNNNQQNGWGQPIVKQQSTVSESNIHNNIVNGGGPPGVTVGGSIVVGGGGPQPGSNNPSQQQQQSRVVVPSSLGVNGPPSLTHPPVSVAGVDQQSQQHIANNPPHTSMVRFELINMFFLENKGFDVIEAIIGKGGSHIQYILNKAQGQVDLRMKGYTSDTAPICDRLHLELKGRTQEITYGAADHVTDLLNSVRTQLMDFAHQRSFQAPGNIGFREHRYVAQYTTDGWRGSDSSVQWKYIR